jgi:hypothetical protein
VPVLREDLRRLSWFPRSSQKRPGNRSLQTASSSTVFSGK